MYLVYPPPPHFKFYITIVSNFSCVLQPKSKIMDMKIFFFNLCFFLGGGEGGKQGALCENGEWQFIPAVRHFT